MINIRYNDRITEYWEIGKNRTIIYKCTDSYMIQSIVCKLRINRLTFPFVNKNFLENTYLCSFMYHLWLLSRYRCRIDAVATQVLRSAKPKMFQLWPPMKNYLPMIQKAKIDLKEETFTTMIVLENCIKELWLFFMAKSAWYIILKLVKQ